MSEYYVSAGQTSSGIVLNEEDCMYVLNGGTASKTTVNGGGSMSISYGGKAVAVKENGGYVNVANGASVTFVSNTFSGLVLEDYNSATVHSGTTANYTSIDNGVMYVYNGGKANYTTVGGYGTELYVCGGKVNSTTVDENGSMVLSSGGVATNTVLKGYNRNNSAYMCVSSGSIASNTTVKNYGSMCVLSGGKISGTLQMTNSSVVSVCSGAVIDFTASMPASSSTVLINDWSLISGRNDASYTITVRVRQTSGKYLLAGGAGSFNKSVTIKNTQGDTLGTITAGKTIVAGDNASYTLNKVNGQLSLTIDRPYQRVVVSNGQTTRLETYETFANPTPYDGNGGAGEVQSGGTLTGSNNTFSGNKAYEGGAIANYGTISMSGSTTFDANSTTGTAEYCGGGAVFNRGGTLNLNGTNVFSGNVACGQSDCGGGGAIYNCENGVVTLSGSNTFVSNTANDRGGGAIRNDRHHYDPSESEYGGLVSLVGTNTFTNNSARSGGAIDGGNFSLEGENTFSGNAAESGGGAIYVGGDCTSASFTISGNNTFSGNTAKTSGGAIYADADLTIAGTTIFAGNSASKTGGAIENYCDLELVGSTTFSGNKATNGGAIYNDAGTVNFAGVVTLATSTDTIYNEGTLNWDLTSTAKGKLVNYQYLTNEGTLAITVGAGQSFGTYVIATGDFTSIDDKKVFTLTGVTGQEDVSITIGGSTVTYNGVKHSLAVDDNGTTSKTDDKLVLTVGNPPDLTVTSLTPSASSVNLGSSVKLSFTIKNAGQITAGASTAYVYNGTKKIGTVAVAALAAGKSASYTYTVAAGNLNIGSNTFKIVADGANKVKESNESNNTRTTAVTVKAADLTISSLKPSASTIVLGSSVKLSFTVKNAGNATASASTAYVYNGTKKIGTVAVAALAAGKSASYTYTVAAGNVNNGSNTFKIVADGANKVKESNENNNSRSTTITAKAADLTVSSLKSSASTVNPGSSVKLSFTIKNSGIVTAGASTAYVYSGSTKIGTVAVAALAAGKSKAYTYTVAGKYLTAVKNTLKIVADGAGKIRESNESNNTKTTTVSVKAADLTVSSLKSSASTVNPGSSVKLTFTIKNAGAWSAGASTAYVYSGSKKIGTVAVAALAAGKSKAYTYTVAGKYLTAVKNTLKIVADGAGKIRESNESNNTKTTTVSVKAADLTITSLTPSSSTVKLGSSVKLTFTIKNAGSWSAGASTAYVYSGSTKIGTIATASIAAGKSITYTCTMDGKYLASGKNTLKIVADGANKVKESNESNNSKTCTVTTSTTLTGTSKNDVFASGKSNDTIKGKGGDDVVCFGSNWGSDTVEQLDADEVTLWFKSGSSSNWNKSTRTYTSGSNSVKVSGKSEVNLKFGDDGSTLYDQLVAAGAFTTSDSKIIGTCKNGILA